MKKILMIGILSFTVLFSFAQSKTTDDKKKNSHFIFAPVIGLNYSGISGSTSSSASYKYIFGAQVGFVVKVLDITQNLNLRAEADFSMMGGKYVYSSDAETLHLNYLNTPVVVRYQSPSGFFGEAGVQPCFLLSAKIKTNSGTEEYKNYINSFDFGIPFGGGYEFKNHIGVGLRLIAGVTEVYKEATASHHNFVGSLRATYSF